MPQPPIEPEPSRFAMPDVRSVPPGQDVIAVGADLDPGTLLAAYRGGMFPMPVQPDKRRTEIAWYSPDPRGVIPLDGLLVSRSLRRSIKRYTTSHDAAFEDVITACADPTRSGRWITDAIVEAYLRLHRLGWAHSVEVWSGDRLVGGLYGVRIGGFFAGESMFHTAVDASKVALVELVQHLRADGATLLDVQWTTDHLRSLGAVDIDRPAYLNLLESALKLDASHT